MISSDTRSDITAAEIAAREQEKLLMLGPVLERMHDEHLDILLQRVFGILQRAGRLPPPPENFTSPGLAVDYISPLAQAQRAIGTKSIERLLGFAGNLLGAYPTLGDVINAEAAVRNYSDLIGAPPEVLRSPEEVAKINEARQQAQQQQAMMQQANEGVQAAALLSRVEARPGNALSQLLGGLQ
jgi:hypothetical protein